MSIEAAAARLLDLSQPIDVPLLESTVNYMYGAGTNEQVRDAAVARNE